MSALRTARVVDWYSFRPATHLPPFAVNAGGRRLFLCLPAGREIRSLSIGQDGRLSDEETLQNLDWSPAGVDYLPDGPGGGWLVAVDQAGTIRHLSMQGLKDKKDWEIDYDWQNKGDVSQKEADSIRMLGVKGFPAVGRALAFGAADGPTGGFIQSYRASGITLVREPLRSKLYEAPYDIDLWNDRFYVATGRGQTIERLRTDDLRSAAEPMASTTPVFKPGRVKVSGRYGIVWVASYNEVFWTGVEDDTLTFHTAVASERDFIGDLALGADETLFASCTNAHEIKVVEPTSCSVVPLAITEFPAGCPSLERPVWLRTVGDLLFVAGPGRGVIWVLSVQ